MFVKSALPPLRMLSTRSFNCPRTRLLNQVHISRTFASSVRRGMPVSSDELKNASGLTANETKGLKERSPEPHEQQIVEGIKDVCLIYSEFAATG